MTPRPNPELIADADELTPDRAGTRTSGADDSHNRWALELRWHNRRLCWGTALAAAASYGVLAGWWTPRGPLTSLAALGAMALSLAVGAVAGLLLRSRWAMLVAPVAFVVAFELMRLRVSGPTVDGVRLDSTYAIMARHPRVGWLGVVVRTVTAAGLVVLPLLSYGWAGVWTWAPDLALALAALAALLATTAVLRLIGLVRNRHRGRSTNLTTDRSVVHVPA